MFMCSLSSSLPSSTLPLLFSRLCLSSFSRYYFTSTTTVAAAAATFCHPLACGSSRRVGSRKVGRHPVINTNRFDSQSVFGGIVDNWCKSRVISATSLRMNSFQSKDAHNSATGRVENGKRTSDSISISQSEGQEQQIKDGDVMLSNESTESSNNSSNNSPLVIIIAGPTGVGKSAVASFLSSPQIASLILQQHSQSNHHYSNHTGAIDKETKTQTGRGHVISADSVQVYRGVQIGANKPSKEEREVTPHHLIDLVDGDSICVYNAADWMRDAMFVLNRLTTTGDHYDDDDDLDTDADDDLGEFENARGKEDAIRRRNIIKEYLSSTTSTSRHDHKCQEKILPVIVGGTMMYLQWLVHGRPDAMKPSAEAVTRAASVISQYQSMDNNDENSCDNDDKGWKAAVEHASSLHPIFASRVSKLSGKDWYRLRRTLEVAYTVELGKGTEMDNSENGDEKNKKRQEVEIEKLYNGKRQGGLLNMVHRDEYGNINKTYDVRCFFLCPDDRMAHTEVIDSRCEDMILKGLLTETTNLSLSGLLPDGGQQARAIGYRQTLDYLRRPPSSSSVEEKTDSEEQVENSEEEIADFIAYLDEFTGATRRYAKKQMQWFRRDDSFAFIPVRLSDSSDVRVDSAAKIIKRMCIMPRKDYERELTTLEKGDGTNDASTMSSTSRSKRKKKSNQETLTEEEEQLPLSTRTKILNERQGRKMKFYVGKRHKLLEGSSEFEKIINEARECTFRMRTQINSNIDSSFEES